MKIFISQPMNGKTKEEILEDRKRIITNLELENNEILDNIFDFDESKNPIYYLGKLLELMSEADTVVFAKDFDLYRGCVIEFEIAISYHKKIMMEGE